MLWLVRPDSRRDHLPLTAVEEQQSESVDRRTAGDRRRPDNRRLWLLKHRYLGRASQYRKCAAGGQTQSERMWTPS